VADIDAYNGAAVDDLLTATSIAEHYQHAPAAITVVLRKDCWRRRYDKRLKRVIEFDRFEDFVTTPPLEGLGASIDLLRKMCQDDIEACDLIDRVTAGRWGGDRKSEHAIKDANSNLDELEKPTGTTRRYALRRLRKDRPDLHARVLGGELSANAAMVEAGFRRKPSTVETLIKTWDRATSEERSAFLEYIKD
jgi:hypothetical protein